MEHISDKGLRIAVVGGGAAGCFCAIGVKRRKPDAEVTVFESGPKLLAKVAVTGGGRCNLTNSFRRVSMGRDREEGKMRLGEVYPRGGQLMRRAFSVLSPADTQKWFEAEGVRLITQADDCVFPVSQDAMQIVRVLERCLRKEEVRVRLASPVERIEAIEGGGFRLRIGGMDPEIFDKVVVTVGGSSREKLRNLLPEGIEVTPCVPSLFTLKIPDEGLHALMGTIVEPAVLSLAGTKFRSEGTLLLTDWGVSGPATLRLSSYAARYLAENAYSGTLLINWVCATEPEARRWLSSMASGSQRRQISGTPPEGITARLWCHLLSRASLREDLRWAELGSKGEARLASVLTSDPYPVAGRARFKEEFVTCGGVALGGINMNTLESKVCPGLHFAGEALDLDAITGGFNLQAAWSTGSLVAAAL